MSNAGSFKPNWVSPPGNTIAYVLEERSLTRRAFADMMSISASYADNIIQGNAPITQDIAQRLSDCIGSSKEFWLRREAQHQERWLNALPVKDMVKFGWISNSEDTYSECLNFFNVRSIISWRDEYKPELELVAFRTSTKLKEQPAATAAWIRQGEIQTAEIQCAPWNSENFRKALTEIRPLTKQKEPKIFIPKLIEICSRCGVAVGVVRTPTGCFASGATKFLNNNRALLLLSFRYLTDDQFWFTFFHEAGHLLLHGQDSLFIEGKSDDLWDEQVEQREKEANKFSEDILMPEEFRYRLSRIPLHKRGIIKFAMEVGVSPGIVVGQLQFTQRVRPQTYNSFKRRYKWDE